MDKSENESLVYASRKLSTKDTFWSSNPISDLIQIEPRSNQHPERELEQILTQGQQLYTHTQILTDQVLEPLMGQSNKPGIYRDLNLGPYLGLGPTYFSDNGGRLLANIDYACDIIRKHTNLASPVDNTTRLTYVDLSGRQTSMIEYLQWRIYQSQGLGLVDTMQDGSGQLTDKVNTQRYSNIYQLLQSIAQAQEVKTIVDNQMGYVPDLVLSDRVKTGSKQFLLEVYTSWLLTKDGGNCVIRLPTNACTRLMYDIYYLLSMYWERISIFTPVAGHIYRHQRYFIGSRRRAYDSQPLVKLINLLHNTFDPNQSILPTSIERSQNYQQFLTWITKIDSHYLHLLKQRYNQIASLLQQQPTTFYLHNVNDLYTIWSCPEAAGGWKLFDLAPYNQLITWLPSSDLQ